MPILFVSGFYCFNGICKNPVSKIWYKDSIDISMQQILKVMNSCCSHMTKHLSRNLAKPRALCLNINIKTHHVPIDVEQAHVWVSIFNFVSF